MAPSAAVEDDADDDADGDLAELAWAEVDHARSRTYGRESKGLGYKTSQKRSFQMAKRDAQRAKAK